MGTNIDIWADGLGLGEVDIRVEPGFQNTFINQINSYNMTADTYIENVQELIDIETKQFNNRTLYTGSKSQKEEDDFFRSYRRLSEIQTWIRARIAQYPNLSSYFTIGKSYEGREIFGIKIQGNSNSKPAILYHGGIHAREWVSPTTVMYIASELLSKYNTNPRIKKLVDNIAWYIIPVLNVDGYEFTFQNRMWRKTRKPNQGSSCIGTDPNRNWGYMWNRGGSSSDPCSDAYHGSSAFSEIEVKQMADYANRIPNLKAYIDFHAYTQLYMRPWGFSTAAPPGENQLKAMGDACAAGISRVHGKTYRSGRIAVIIYVASGSSADYFYQEKKIPAYGIELRPATAGGGGFILPPNEIVPTGQENLEGALIMGERVLN